MLLHMPADCTPESVASQSGQILSQILRPELYDKHLTPDPQGVNVSIELALQVALGRKSNKIITI